MAAKKKPGASHADYTKAFRLVGTLFSNPNLPKAHQKLSAGFTALQTDFGTSGREWLKPAAAAPSPAGKSTKRSPAKAKALPAAGGV